MAGAAGAAVVVIPRASGCRRGRLPPKMSVHQLPVWVHAAGNYIPTQNIHVIKSIGRPLIKQYKLNINKKIKILPSKATKLTFRDLARNIHSGIVVLRCYLPR